METKKDKFIRLSNQRVAKVLDEMRKLTNLVTPSYESSQNDRLKIVSALRGAVEEIEYAFSGEKADKRKFLYGDVKVEVEENEPETVE